MLKYVLASVWPEVVALYWKTCVQNRREMHLFGENLEDMEI